MSRNFEWIVYSCKDEQEYSETFGSLLRVYKQDGSFRVFYNLGKRVKHEYGRSTRLLRLAVGKIDDEGFARKLYKLYIRCNMKVSRSSKTYTKLEALPLCRSNTQDDIGFRIVNTYHSCSVRGGPKSTSEEHRRV